MAADLSRRELYDLLWTERTVDVARKLALDEWILREICKRHRVPVPPPSYWRDIEAGKVPRRAVFVDTLDPAVEHVGFGLSTRPRIEEEERPAAKRPPSARVKLQKREPNPRSIEWEPVKKPHAGLAATANALRRARAEGGMVAVRGGGRRRDAVGDVFDRARDFHSRQDPWPSGGAGPGVRGRGQLLPGIRSRGQRRLPIEGKDRASPLSAAHKWCGIEQLVPTD